MKINSLFIKFIKFCFKQKSLERGELFIEFSIEISFNGNSNKMENDLIDIVDCFKQNFTTFEKNN